MKKTMAIFLAIIMVVGLLPINGVIAASSLLPNKVDVWVDGARKIAINGKEQSIPTEYGYAFIDSTVNAGRTMVPVHYVAYALGLNLKNDIIWNETNYTMTIYIPSKSNPQRTVVLKQDSSTATVNGVQQKMYTGVQGEADYQEYFPTVYADNVLYMPFRGLGEILGVTVDDFDREAKGCVTFNRNTVKLDFFVRFADTKNQWKTFEVKWIDDFFNSSAATGKANQDLAIASMILSESAYRKDSVSTTLNKLGFKDVKSYQYDENNFFTAAHTFARKTVGNSTLRTYTHGNNLFNRTAEKAIYI